MGYQHKHESSQSVGDRLRKLFIQLKHQAGLPGAHFVPSALNSVHENAQRSYVPLAAADQQHQRLLFNAQSPDAAPAMAQDPRMQRLMNAQNARYQQGVIAHETGHLLEPALIRGRAGADRYTDAAFGTKARAPYWLQHTPQGRGEVRRDPNAILQRDPWGLPMQGPGDLHSAPNEQYANDAGAALGHRFTPGYRGERGLREHDAGYALSAANPRLLRQLQRGGLLPPSRKNKRK